MVQFASVLLYGHHSGKTNIEPNIIWLCVLGNLETSIKVVLYGQTLRVIHENEETRFFDATGTLEQ
jgi:hypothetical protein